MLKKEHRVTENREFLKIFKSVRPLYTDHFAIRAAKRTSKTESKSTEGQPEGSPLGRSNTAVANNTTIQQFINVPSRFGFVVSNKIDKRAARRNGLKRRIRAVIEHRLSDISGGNDVVIQVKKSFDYPYDYKAIEMEVVVGLKRAGILK